MVTLRICEHAEICSQVKRQVVLIVKLTNSLLKVRIGLVEALCSQAIVSVRLPPFGVVLQNRASFLVECRVSRIFFVGTPTVDAA